MAANHEIPKGPEPGSEKNLAKAQSGDMSHALKEVFGMDKGSVPQFKTDAMAKDSSREVTAIAAKDLAKADFRSPEATKTANEKLAETVKNVLNLTNGADKIKQVTALSDLVNKSVEATRQYMASTMKRHDEALASLPPDQQAAANDRLIKMMGDKA